MFLLISFCCGLSSEYIYFITADESFLLILLFTCCMTLFKFEIQTKCCVSRYLFELFEESSHFGRFSLNTLNKY